MLIYLLGLSQDRISSFCVVTSATVSDGNPKSVHFTSLLEQQLYLPIMNRSHLNCFLYFKYQCNTVTLQTQIWTV